MSDRTTNPLISPEQARLDAERAIQEGSLGPVRMTGLKLDDHKPLPWKGLIEYFPDALIEVAEISKEGTLAPGHVWGGWRDVQNGFERYTEAMVRHIFEEAQICRTPVPDSAPDLELIEMQIKAAATVAWNSLARLQHLIWDLKE